MAPHLSAVELDHVQQLLQKGKSRVEIHDYLRRLRGRRNVEPPHITNIRKMLKGLTYKRSAAETRKGGVDSFFVRKEGVPLSVFLLERNGCRWPFLLEREGCRWPLLCSNGRVAVGRFLLEGGEGGVDRFFVRKEGLPLPVFLLERKGCRWQFLLERRGCRRWPLFCPKGRVAVVRKGCRWRFLLEREGEGGGTVFYSKGRGTVVRFFARKEGCC